MTTRYDIIRHQVVPVIEHTAHRTGALLSAGKKTESDLGDAYSACRAPSTAAALQAFRGSFADELNVALRLAERVITAGATATKDYVMADYHMTAHAHHALEEAIPNPRDHVLEQQR